ncbi:bifunctional adenosylcobinamide kinase/adenosylcobinamide-phosphate guanylyltransferase [Paenibacillus sp. strain BS8-2]
MAILVTGGARSGKSSFAERYARSISHEGIYLASGRAYDSEMEERISQHRLDRELQSGMNWTTIEEPYAVAAWLQQRTKLHSQQQQESFQPVVVMDCLTLWLTNWLLLEEEDCTVDIQQEVERLIAAIAAYPWPLILVTNEVGDGIVPSYPLGRRFRDEAGRLNQRIAAICEKVFLVTSGIPIDLRSIAFRFEDES